jgi:hypothetical protein
MIYLFFIIGFLMEEHLSLYTFILWIIDTKFGSIWLGSFVLQWRIEMWKGFRRRLPSPVILDSHLGFDSMS